MGHGWSGPFDGCCSLEQSLWICRDQITSKDYVSKSIQVTAWLSLSASMYGQKFPVCCACPMCNAFGICHPTSAAGRLQNIYCVVSLPCPSVLTRGSEGLFVWKRESLIPRISCYFRWYMQASWTHAYILCPEKISRQHRKKVADPRCFS